MRVLSLVGRMDRMYIEDICFDEDGASAVKVPLPRILVFGVTGMTDEATRAFCSWVLSGEASRDIRSFYTTVRSRAEAIAMQDVIEGLGRTLTTFETTVDAAESLAGNVSVSYCRTLLLIDSQFSCSP